ncbi:MAG: amidohydrolase [Actinobacteria bacterium]|nr:amidohydrolase [Actinomycetota bacterium]
MSLLTEPPNPAESDPGFDVVAVRRDLHAHPEVAYHEVRTTALLSASLREVGLRPVVLPAGTGLTCDIGEDGPMIALRADIDALPLRDLKDVPYRSTVDNVAHACGHDAHTAMLLGAARRLARLELAGRVRLIFEPAEETLPGGALSVIATDALAGVEQIFALHCDPRLVTGLVGLRVGPITAACDIVRIELNGPGGHTARPHLTADLIYALGRLITELPGLLSRRVDPRAALTLVWGAVEAGHASNAIPTSGSVQGTLRVFDRFVWDAAEPLVRELVDAIVAGSRVAAEVHYVRGVPPVENHPVAVDVQRAAVVAALGPQALAQTVQSMGGEDFAWYLDKVPGALARIGVGHPDGPVYDLHQGTFDIDEDALELGVRYTVALARTALERLG